MLDLAREVLDAERRIRPHVVETPLIRSTAHEVGGGMRVWLKQENLQHTGSFKVRGALNKLLALSEEQRARGIVAASTGNHGAAVAYALRQLGAHGTVFVPEDALPAKLRKIEALGGQIEVFGKDSVEAEKRARAHAQEHGLVFVSPYNDPQVVGGQGTVGVELTRQLDGMDAVFVAVGGGGLIAGLAAAVRRVWPGVRIIGCSPENSPVMIRSQQAGRILDLPSLPTLSDGTAGGIEPDSITFEPCRELVDDYVTVSEDEIANELERFDPQLHGPVEGAAAVAAAAWRQCAGRFDHLQDGDAVIVLCGGNR